MPLRKTIKQQRKRLRRAAGKKAMAMAESEARGIAARTEPKNIARVVFEHAVASGSPYAFIPQRIVPELGKAILNAMVKKAGLSKPAAERAKRALPLVAAASWLKSMQLLGEKRIPIDRNTTRALKFFGRQAVQQAKAEKVRGRKFDYLASIKSAGRVQQMVEGFEHSKYGGLGTDDRTIDSLEGVAMRHLHDVLGHKYHDSFMVALNDCLVELNRLANASTMFGKPPQQGGKTLH